METNKHLNALMEIEEILPQALALADLLQAVGQNDDLIDRSSIGWGADMIHTKLKEIDQIVKDGIEDRTED